MPTLSRLLTAAMVVLTTLVGCTFEHSDNGDLDGYWQLTTVDTLHSGHTTDMLPKSIFWAVQMRLLEVRDLGNDAPNILFRMNYQANTLTLSDPVVDWRDRSDLKLTNPDMLQPYAINSLNPTFTILQLDGTHMVLQDQHLRLHFRRY